MANRKPFMPSFRMTMNMSQTQAQEVWSSLDSSIQKIFLFEASSLSFEELYRKGYDLVIQKYGDLLYNGLSNSVRYQCKLISDKLSTQSDTALLETMNESWKNYKKAMEMVKDILMYMDRNYVKQKNVQPVFELGFTIFYEEVLKDSLVSKKVSDYMLESIQKERNGEVIERFLLKNITSMLVELGNNYRSPYKSIFEERFLEETRRYYETEAQELISGNSCTEFLRKAEARLKEEKERVQLYLSEPTETLVLSILDSVFIESYSNVLIGMDTGCERMIRNQQIDDLRRLYQLFSRVPETLREISNCVGNFIQKEGKAILAENTHKKSPLELVNSLLNLRETFHDILNNAFNRGSMMETVMKISFENFINETTRTAMALTLYLDNLMRKEIRGMREEVLEQKLSQVVILFRFISDKDVFENFYRHYLSKRLLQNRSQSEDAEKLFITKLKTECGSHFTSKLEGMINDMQLSKSSNEEYQKAEERNIEVSVLTEAFWPTEQVTPMLLPQEVSYEAERFRRFYLAKHNGRRLTWKTSMGTAEVRAMLGDNWNRHELHVTTYQMAVVLLFNEREFLSFEEILKIYNINDSEFHRHVLGLVKSQIICKSTEGKEIKNCTEFFLNPSFRSKLYRIKVPILASKEPEIAASKEEMPEMVIEDRKHMIEASIVKVMKSRRQIDHSSLLSEVIRLISWRFVPAPKLIKNRIESLIEREYLERDSNTPNIYKYIV